MTLLYWLLIGWWWALLKLTGRITLWLLCWPLGLWRSLHHSQAKHARRAAR